MDYQIILEFNEEIQGWHFNYIVNGKPQSPINTNGYHKLMVCRNNKEADLFADFLHSQFREKGEKLTISKALSTIDNLTNFICAYNKYKL
jgi:hypothetical protein